MKCSCPCQTCHVSRCRLCKSIFWESTGAGRRLRLRLRQFTFFEDWAYVLGFEPVPPPPPPCCPCVPGTTMLDHGLDRPDGCPRDLDLLQLVCSLHVRCYASCMLYLRSLCFLGKTGRKDRIFCWFDIFVSPMLGMLLDGAGSQNCCCGQGCDMATEFLISERPKVLEFQL